MVMVSAISASISLCSSSTSTKSPLCTLSYLVPYLKTSKFNLSPWFPQLGPILFSPYSGLKHLGISISSKSLKLERKRCRGRVVHASLFGVGAPEALVIGVVALLVFGPKGLAEAEEPTEAVLGDISMLVIPGCFMVARNLGKTLRAFQPTIRELQDVSREFKSTLEREIGLDDVSLQNTYNSNRTNTSSTPSSAASTQDPQNVAKPNGTPSPNRAYTSEEYLKITEEQVKASATQQSGQTSPGESQLEPQTKPQATVRETAATTPPTQVSESEA